MTGVHTHGMEHKAQRSPFPCREPPCDEGSPRGQQAEASSGKGELAELGVRQGPVAESVASKSG